ncbi:nucleic acid binding protein, putative [Plasmodium berghei]|uniref:Nucleic acid binding protein, putative n=2 Tax=Plasmodium berghei TaxID=5821 RepID=A0A509AKK6_PLABA|nr:nucleic acid binding protein, putative [Plasmodium berghei ANKA]CXI46247.1 nucleic acid binding protein, putative [Plasmodium berghei]SCM22764.1 nucleic acid binding protein, putative [Plasmodium berghei]SCN25669.1 nucleic acid binding protein, putative [Plasmodium berghei]SCO60597.1 nucleic acid binding protein, putative [Plasmodium berghei]SCO62333.1 nucleic acid binding protein, putative [Plasmodium berghei]|eukprot:XP_034421750.1 nucleic acid binding protein, putative [Plasmodium berghei ANKA]
MTNMAMSNCKNIEENNISFNKGREDEMHNDFLKKKKRSENSEIDNNNKNINSFISEQNKETYCSGINGNIDVCAKSYNLEYTNELTTCYKTSENNKILINNQEIESTHLEMEKSDINNINNLSKYKNELDNRIKRKNNPLKQNKENKKIKKNFNNEIRPILNDSNIQNNSDFVYDINKTNNTTISDTKYDNFNENIKTEVIENKAILVKEALKEYPRIFVTRLPFEVNKKDLEKYFSKYGKIIDIYISKNLSNNKNKGFGFVSFENQISMDKALSEKLHIICGKEIVVDVASMRNSKSKHLFYLPYDHYLSKGSKNEKKYTKKIQNNNTNFNPYLNIQNNINTRDISQNMRNDFFMSNYYNIYPNNNDNTSIDLLNHKYIFKNNIPFPYFLPFGYNADPKYLNQLSYSNFTDCTTPDYYWNFTQHCNWNNSYLHNENIYNSKNMEHPYDFSNPQYINQGVAILKNKMTNQNTMFEQSKLTYPTNMTTYRSYRNNHSSFIRKLHGVDEWNKREYKLFVTKLNSVTTIETLRNYFESYGEIIDIYMPNDICTNKPRGIAFVTFLDSECVKKILSNKNYKHIIDGKEVVVDLADPETKSKKNVCYS